MDHRISIKNGIESTKEVLQKNKNLKFILICADKKIKDNVLVIGAIILKEKPFSMSNLVENIQKALK